MQSKIYNAYKITHKNGTIEDINALDMVQALENMEVSETESKVAQIFLVKENVRTLIEDEKEEILFTAVTQGGIGSIATPSQGKIHSGDQIALKAIPANGYVFVSWSLNGDVISNESELLFTMPKLSEGLDAVFTASFKDAPVEWVTEVSPKEAASTVIVFPEGGTGEIGDDVSAIAISGETYKFSHWERSGTTLGTNQILSGRLSPLTEDETEGKAVFTAVFKAVSESADTPVDTEDDTEETE